MTILENWWGTLKFLSIFSHRSEVTYVGDHICLHFALNKESSQVVFTCVWAKILYMDCIFPCAGAFYLCSWKPQCIVRGHPHLAWSQPVRKPIPGYQTPLKCWRKQKEEESGLLYWQEKMKFEETAVYFWGIVLIWNFITRKSIHFWP